MAIMLGKLYDALRDAGATEIKAREASEEVADFERRISRIETMVAVNTAILSVVGPFVVAMAGRSFGSF